MPKVSVFCASSSRVDPKYLNAATELGYTFCDEDITLVYGGGSAGLMGMSMPMVIVNLDGYFDPFIEMLNRCVDEKFMNETDRQLWQVVDTVADVVPLLRKLWLQNT